MLKLVNTFKITKIEFMDDQSEVGKSDDRSERAENVEHEAFKFMDEEENNVNVVLSFLAFHEVMESEQGSYVSVNGEGYDVSNNLDHEDPMEFSLV